MGPALEQAYRQALLKRQHGIGDGRLRDMLGGRGHRELPGLRGRDEIAELPQRDFLGQSFRAFAHLEHGGLRGIRSADIRCWNS
ncbi:hypothetical protein D3C72_2053650 [compost metagenome]